MLSNSKILGTIKKIPLKHWRNGRKEKNLTEFLLV